MHRALLIGFAGMPNCWHVYSVGDDIHQSDSGPHVTPGDIVFFFWAAKTKCGDPTLSISFARLSDFFPPEQ